jgi:HK97 family phage prohead protease
MTRSQTLAAPEGFQPGGTLAREMRFAIAGSYDSKARTVEGVFAAGSPVRRWGFIETLNMDASAVDLSRVAQGQCKLLDSHNSFEIDAILGVVEEARLEGGQLVGRIRFAETEAGRKAEGMVARGELTGFSIGYSIKRWTNVSQEDTGVETWRADEWSLLEVTLCAVPADPAATVRAVAPSGNVPGSKTEEDDMTRAAQPAAAAAVESNPPATPAPAVAETRAAPQADPAPADPEAARAQPAALAAPAAMDARAAVALLQRADFYGQRELAERMIGEGRDEATVIAAVQEARRLAGDVAATIGGPRTQIGRDETETRRRAMEDALAINLGAGGEPNETARSFMSNRDLVEFAADHVGHRGRLGGFAEREDVLRRAFHTTSDFPILLENALNRSLRARYLAATPTYRAIAQQRTYMDFRDHISVRDGDFPQMKEVLETGEIKAGTFSESKEKTAVKAYGVRVGFSRQLLVNDNLGAIQRVLNNRAESVARFEDETFYAMMLSAAGAGPTLLETSRAVFNTTDKTLASSGAAIDITTLSTARAAMRAKTSKDGTKLNIAPAILLVGPAYETIALQYTSSAFVPNQSSVVNPFSGKLRVEVTPEITGNAWYLFAEPNVGANFEWGLLEGYQAPRMRMDEPFGTQGMSVSLEHDFGCGAIDFRFAYRNPGA